MSSGDLDLRPFELKIVLGTFTPKFDASTFSVLELGPTRRRHKRTDRRTGKTRNAAYEDSRIISNLYSISIHCTRIANFYVGPL